MSEARGRLAELVDGRVRDGEIVYLTRYGRRVGAVVPAEAAERLDELEDAYWSRRAADALTKLAEEPPVPWNQAVAELESGDTAGR